MRHQTSWSVGCTLGGFSGGAFALAGIAGVLLIAMHAVAAAVAGGASGWLNLVVLILAWDAIKLGVAALATFLRATWTGARRVRLRVVEPGRATP